MLETSRGGALDKIQGTDSRAAEIIFISNAEIKCYKGKHDLDFLFGCICIYGYII